MQRLKDAAEALSEHFDTVAIFVTRHEEGEIGTTNASWGTGNFFTRWGQLEKWMARERARDQAAAIVEAQE